MRSLKAQKPSPSTLLLLPSREEKLGKLLHEVFQNGFFKSPTQFKKENALERHFTFLIIKTVHFGNVADHF